MFTFDRTDLQRIAISLIGALTLVIAAAVGVSGIADQATAPAIAGQLR